MKISSVSNSINNFALQNKNNKKAQNTAFKGIYVEKNVRLGNVAESKVEPKFLPKDALLLNEIASMYPNQDCFIRRDKSSFPRLEYREKPPEVTMFHENYAKFYETNIVPDDEKYPCIPLIIYPDSNLNEYIGMTSSMSLNPSLPYTIKAGYEVHKKIMEKKYQIMDVIGHVDNVSLGDDSIIEKSHEAIDDVETAVTRYLLECSYTALTDKMTAKQFYSSNIPKIQARLSAKRRLDLTTPSSKLPAQIPSQDRKDICEMAMEEYPNTEENKNEIEKLVNHMLHYGMFIG